LEDVHGHALPELDQSQEEMLRPHVIVIEPIGFLASEL
jgi:hypothetical protein